MDKIEYLLIKLGEEACEISLATSKALTFGLDDNYTEVSPAVRIAQEFNDFIAVIEMLEEEGVDFRYLYSDKQITAKKNKVKKFFRYSLKRGILEE